MRKDVCTVYGQGRNIRTPHIDRLAETGVTVTNAVSCCPLCTPYRGMLHTGRYPTHTGILGNFLEVSAAQQRNSLAETFTRAGYDTAFIGKWHLAAGQYKKAGRITHDQSRIRAYMTEENPEPEFVPPGPGRLGYGVWQGFNFHVAFNEYWYYSDEPTKIQSGKYETDAQTDQAIRYMEERREGEKPFLLVVAPHPPHPPFSPNDCPEGYLEQIPESLTWSPNVPADNPRSVHDMRCYLAMAKNVDDNIGRLIDYLDRSGLAEDTIVVFTSDHGEMHGSHGRLNKMVPYAEAIDIPLIIRWPGDLRPGTTDTLASPMDLFPTLAGLAGIGISREVEGVDLSAVIRGETQSGRDAILIANYTSHWNYFQSGTNWPEWRGVRTQRYTYCRWLSGSEELYDNLEDPYQMTNLAEGRKELPALQRMRNNLKELLVSAHDDFQPGTRYADWYDEERNLIRTGLGPVAG
jgi:arylsulfatase A-like enzyme